MKTPDEILDWLVRHSTYYKLTVSSKQIQDMVNLEDDGCTLWSLVNSIPPFHARLEEFSAFVGEPYSFSRHILPAIEVGLIHCRGHTVSGLYASDEYRYLFDLFDGTWGLVKDENVPFVRWWLGKS